MKKINFRKLGSLAGAILALSIGFASCSNDVEVEERETAFLTISVNDGTRTILPEFDLNTMQYTLYGTLQGGQKRTLGTFADYKSLQTDILSLETGNWEFELEGANYLYVNIPDDFNYGYLGSGSNPHYYDKNNFVDAKYIKVKGSVFKGTCTKAVDKGANHLSFALELKSDHSTDISTGYYYDSNNQYHSWDVAANNAGSIDVTLSLPSGTNVYVKASLDYINPPDPNGTYPNAANITSVTDEILVVKDSKVTFKKDNVYYGCYDLRFDIYDDQEYQVKVNTYKETVKVVAGCTSRAQRTVEYLNNDFHRITFDLGSGTCAEGYVLLETFVTNQKTKLPDPFQVVRNDGYVLEGFYDNPSFTGRRYTEIEGLAQDLTMYAKWVKGIAVAGDKVKDLNLAAVTEPITLAHVGEMTSDLITALEKAANDIDLVLYGAKKLIGLSSLPKLKSVVICNGVTEIPQYMFKGCSGLTSITIPSSVTAIGDYAFNGCNNLTKLYIDDMAAYLKIDTGSNNYGTLLFCSANSSGRIYVKNVEVTDLVIPEGITKINPYAFCNCSSITSVTIPSSVTEIGGYAFSGCNNLTNIVIPDGITIINSHTFFFCSSLTSVTIPSSVEIIGDWAFYGCSINTIWVDSLESYNAISFGDWNSSLSIDKVKVKTN